MYTNKFKNVKLYNRTVSYQIATQGCAIPKYKMQPSYKYKTISVEINDTLATKCVKKITPKKGDLFTLLYTNQV